MLVALILIRVPAPTVCGSGNLTTAVRLAPLFLNRPMSLPATSKWNSPTSSPPTIPPTKVNDVPVATVNVANVTVAPGVMIAEPKLLTDVLVCSTTLRTTNALAPPTSKTLARVSAVSSLISTAPI